MAVVFDAALEPVEADLDAVADLDVVDFEAEPDFDDADRLDPDRFDAARLVDADLARDDLAAVDFRAVVGFAAGVSLELLAEGSDVEPPRLAGGMLSCSCRRVRVVRNPTPIRGGGGERAGWDNQVNLDDEEEMRMRARLRSMVGMARTGPWRAAGPAGLVAAGLVCALLFGGCGASSSVSNAVDPVAKAATVSHAAAGYRMRLAMRIASSSLPGPITASGGGSFSPASRTGSVGVTMNFGSIPGVAQVLGSSTLDLSELIDGTVFYVKLPPALAGKLPGASTRPWIKIDLAKAASAAGIPGLSSLLGNPASSNPAAMLDYLRAVSGSVKKVGTGTVDGHSTTHYRATLDLTKYPKLVAPSQRAAAGQAVAALKRLAKVTSLPVDVWIDSSHLVRRMAFDFAEQLPNGGGSVQSAITIDITDYGPQPALSFPSADQVTDLSSLTGAHLP